MKSRIAKLSVSLIFLLAASAHNASAAETCDEADILYATTPAPPTATYLWRTYLEQMSTNVPANLDVLLIGDSLIYQWPISLLSPLEVASYGIGGDKAQNVLWRLASPEFPKLKPKNILIFIGTNSLPSDKSCVIIAGMKKLVAQVSLIWPRARIFMLEVPPRGQDLKFRNDVRLEVNSAIREMPSIKPIAVDDAIACSWKTPCENYNADGVHFTSAGYKILTKLLREALSQ
jgi:hypothetical protein